MNLPNKLTVFRVLLVPVMIIVSFFDIPGNFLGVPTTYWILELIFIIASITDELDGRIARKRNLVTNFGKFLDPIADKVLVITTLIILVEKGRIPGWIPAIIVFREFIVSGYRLIAVEKSKNVIAANIWGKLKTVLQMFAIIFALVDNNKFGTIFIEKLDTIPFVINLSTTVLMILCVIATIFSGWTYIKNGKELFKNDM